MLGLQLTGSSVHGDAVAMQFKPWLLLGVLG